VNGRGDVGLVPSAVWTRGCRGGGGNGAGGERGVTEATRRSWFRNHGDDLGVVLTRVDGVGGEERPARDPIALGS
jgi:hypothetical protein